MANQNVLHSHKLRMALQRLEGATGGLPEASHETWTRLSETGAERVATHAALVSGLGRLHSQSAEATKSNAASLELVLKRAEEYRTVMSQSAQSLERNLEGPLHEMEGLGDSVYNGLYEQEAALRRYEVIDGEGGEVLHRELSNLRAALLKSIVTLSDAALSLSCSTTDIEAAVVLRREQAGQERENLANSLLVEATKAFRSEGTAACQSLLDRAVQVAPRSAGVWLRLAQLELALGRHDRAQECYRQSLDLGSTDPDLHYVAGALALARKDLGVAQTCFEQYVSRALTPAAHLAGRLSLAETFYYSGQPHLALETWRSVLADEPAHPLAQARVDLLT